MNSQQSRHFQLELDLVRSVSSSSCNTRQLTFAMGIKNSARSGAQAGYSSVWGEARNDLYQTRE